MIFSKESQSTVADDSPESVSRHRCRWSSWMSLKAPLSMILIKQFQGTVVDDPHRRFLMKHTQSNTIQRKLMLSDDDNCNRMLSIRQVKMQLWGSQEKIIIKKAPLSMWVYFFLNEFVLWYWLVSPLEILQYFRNRWPSNYYVLTWREPKILLMDLLYTIRPEVLYDDILDIFRYIVGVLNGWLHKCNTDDVISCASYNL